MTIAILIWQAIIFTTIAASGRARGWVVAGWAVWTIIQVATFPLSVIQFLTIGLAYWMFSGSKSAAISAPAKPVDPEVEAKRLAEEAQKLAEHESWKQKRSEKRSKGLVWMLVFGAVGGSAIYWMDAGGVNGFTFLVFGVCAFGFLINMNKAMD